MDTFVPPSLPKTVRLNGRPLRWTRTPPRVWRTKKRAGSVSDTSPTKRSHAMPRAAHVIARVFLLSSQDTDSLMEWWYTVERESLSHSLYFEFFSQWWDDGFVLVPEWDEVPSDDDDRVDESKYVCSLWMDFVELILQLKGGLLSFEKPGLSPSWRTRCSAACGSSTRSSQSAPRFSGSTSSRSTPSLTTSASSTRRPRSPASPGGPPPPWVAWRPSPVWFWPPSPSGLLSS